MKPPKMTEGWVPSSGRDGLKEVLREDASVGAYSEFVPWFVQDDEEASANFQFFKHCKLAAKVLERILAAHTTKNNGAVMGEAILSDYFAVAAKQALLDCGYTED